MPNLVCRLAEKQLASGLPTGSTRNQGNDLPLALMKGTDTTQVSAASKGIAVVWLDDAYRPYPLVLARTRQQPACVVTCLCSVNISWKVVLTFDSSPKGFAESV